MLVNQVIVMKVLIVKRDIEEIENKVLLLEVVIVVNLKKEKIIEIEVHNLKKIVHKIERKIDIIVMKEEKRILVTAKIIIDL